VLCEDLFKEGKQCLVELPGTMEQGEMAHPGQNNKLCVRNAFGQIIGVLPFDELVELTLDNNHGYTDPRQVLRRIIWLRSLHQSKRGGKLLESPGSGLYANTVNIFALPRSTVWTTN